MQGILYEEPSVWLFLLVTCFLGGGAAWITGRATAQNWQSLTALFFSILGLGVAVRFIHHAMFEGTMFSLHYYLVDTLLLMVIGFISFRFRRTRQMTRQYYWLYERTGLFTWRSREKPVGQA